MPPVWGAFLWLESPIPQSGDQHEPGQAGLGQGARALLQLRQLGASAIGFDPTVQRRHLLRATPSIDFNPCLFVFSGAGFTGWELQAIGFFAAAARLSHGGGCPRKPFPLTGLRSR